MEKMLFIEIISDDSLRLYDGKSVVSCNTDALNQHLKKYSNKTKITLLDSLYIQSKTFEHPVKDKKILNQVIVAEMRDYLLNESDAYHFAHNDFNNVKWVSWIEKSRVIALKERFSDILSRIVGLVSLPLLIESAIAKQNNTKSPWIIDSPPLIYALSHGQTVVIPSVQKQAWIDSLSKNAVQPFELSDIYNVIFQEQAFIKVPNLWNAGQSASQTSNIPQMIYPGLLMLAIVLLISNSYIDYRQAIKSSKAALDDQQMVLKQVYPHAQATADPYGRLSAEFQRLSSDVKRQKIIQLNQLLEGHAVELSEMTFDLDAQQIYLKGTVDQALKQSFADSGFTIDEQTEVDNHEVILSW